MQVTIVGLPGSGKSTVFNALTGGHAETGGFSSGRAAPNIGVVKVPDERLDRLAELFHPKKVTPADVTYVDVAIAAGAAREGTIQPEVLALIRDADALLHVARAFADPAADRAADPWRDVEEMDLEFTVADLSVVEKRLEKLRTSGRHGSVSEREQNALEEELLARLEPHLSDGLPLRSFGLTEDEERRLRGYRFLTQKPVLVVLSIDEDALATAENMETQGRSRYAQPQSQVAAMAAKIEAEIAQLSAEDAALFMEDLGIAEASRGRIIRLTYGLLGLFSFFTAGEDECRAWTLRTGDTAVEAAGAIHSDLARGFIRAEVVTYPELMAAGSMAEARKRGVLRSEGKAYQVNDGDVIQVLFNVAR
ncbi:MAG TPA: redox-regulated ATPase YchF [Candidatus Limnocylindria bacterium]|nr:redox-regulated ATPase YchF [Candidatus Limnocylindria bacterium]